MKKPFLLLLLIGSLGTSYACDICGCAPGSYDPFLFPHLSRHYVGVSYQHRVYETRSTHGDTKQYFNSFLVSGQYSIGKRIQVMGMIPYQVNKLVSEEGTTNLSGLGDISLLINYKPLDLVSPNSRHTLILGAGAKLPTGEYASQKTGSLDEQNFQLGTGSIDYLLNGSYHFSYRKLALSLASSYKYNTQNKDDYRYGDVFNTRTTASYRFDVKKISINPYVQLIHEKQMKDADHHVLQPQSGGSILYTGGGLDLTLNRVAVGISYLSVANQSLAGGEINVKPRLSSHISFIF